MTAGERIAALEAENARLLDFAERQAAEQARLCTNLERITAVVARMAGIEEPEPVRAEIAAQPCRIRPPARRYRRAQGGAQ